MATKRLKPDTPSRRFNIVPTFEEITKSKPERKLTVALRKTGGRNHHGKITSRRRGGGHKRLYRKIDFKRNKLDISATVERLEYDPNRSAFIALLKYDDGELSYIVAPQRLSVGDKVISSEKADIKPGNTMPMKKMPIGTIIHNIEMKPGKGAQLIRSAGTFAQLVGRDQGMAILKLTSGEQRLIPDVCKATVGAVSNPDNSNTKLAKAGRNRWKGKRPSVRGVVMNPVDHPHGGGEGKTSGGRHPVTPWGVPTKGKKTRSNKDSDKFIVRTRHQKRKRR